MGATKWALERHGYYREENLLGFEKRIEAFVWGQRMGGARNEGHDNINIMVASSAKKCEFVRSQSFMLRSWGGDVVKSLGKD